MAVTRSARILQLTFMELFAEEAADKPQGMLVKNHYWLTHSLHIGLACDIDLKVQ